jgi:tRNA-splicing ligase RtcB (3'-phosphate/5'-hydroxy nucleic acid ligase)
VDVLLVYFCNNIHTVSTIFEREKEKIMFTLQGKYNSATVFTNNCDETTQGQIITLLNQEWVKDSKIRIMPDTHAGKGCVIGFTMEIKDKIVANLVGVDIGCGMLVVELEHFIPDFSKLDETIREKIPSGKNAHLSPKVKFDLTELYCYPKLKNIPHIAKSLGTLGGGNHFIEVDKDENGNYFLVIHTGSRNLGKQVAEIYQEKAIENTRLGNNSYESLRSALIESYKQSKFKGDLQAALKKLKEQSQNKTVANPDLAYLEGLDASNYLHDMKICQRYARINREIFRDIILENLFGTVDFDSFETVHNYINFKDNILRKGAISARSGEKVIIPINMRDGAIIALGKGNPDWNYSAPHGAGRILSRSQAKKTILMDDYKDSMKGVFTTSVSQSTLDEAPQAYKPIEEIIENTKDSIEILSIIKPVYNYKDGNNE